MLLPLTAAWSSLVLLTKLASNVENVDANSSCSLSFSFAMSLYIRKFLSTKWSGINIERSYRYRTKHVSYPLVTLSSCWYFVLMFFTPVSVVSHIFLDSLALPKLKIQTMLVWETRLRNESISREMEYVPIFKVMVHDCDRLCWSYCVFRELGFCFL